MIYYNYYNNNSNSPLKKLFFKSYYTFNNILIDQNKLCNGVSKSTNGQ